MKIECPHCRQTYEVDESYAGQFIECDSCHKGFEAKRPIERHEPPTPQVKTVIDPPLKEKSHSKLMPCPACNKQVYVFAEMCPSCGCPIGNQVINRSAVAVVYFSVLIFAILILYSFLKPSFWSLCGLLPVVAIAAYFYNISNIKQSGRITLLIVSVIAIGLPTFVSVSIFLAKNRDNRDQAIALRLKADRKQIALAEMMNETDQGGDEKIIKRLLELEEKSSSSSLTDAEKQEAREIAKYLDSRYIVSLSGSLFLQ